MPDDQHFIVDLDAILRSFEAMRAETAAESGRTRGRRPPVPPPASSRTPRSRCGLEHSPSAPMNPRTVAARAARLLQYFAAGVAT